MDPGHRPSGNSVIQYSAMVLIGAIPILVLAGFAYLISTRSVERLVHRGNDTAAAITAALIEREFDHWQATLASHASFPTLAGAVASGDADEVRRRLEIFVTAHRRLERAFVTDQTGLLWVDFPEAPESLGRRFDHRDWFAGVARAQGPYVSEVYRRTAFPPIPVVAVAVPVHSPRTNELAGYMVAQVRLDGLSELLRQVEVGSDGMVFLLDHTGALVAHPTLDLHERLFREYSAVLPPRAARSERITRGRYEDPFTGEAMVVSLQEARIGNHRWNVISQQPATTAFSPIRALALQLGSAGALMTGVMIVLFFSVVRENRRRSKAEAELLSLNRTLEARVEERTAALKERDEQLHQARKMEAVGRLAGGVAHDFNNFLTVILGSVELLRSRLPSEAEGHRELAEVHQSAERAADLTRQLLAFSRKQVMKPQIININESVERMRGILERVLGEHIDLVWRLTPDLHPVKFDPGQIEQVLINLAANARDAMPEGGKLTIETANVDLDEEYSNRHPGTLAGPHAMLAVTDTGTGMDDEARKMIFEPFYTTKGFGKGTGLGLSTVYGIIQQGGGTIWVYSEPGRGTTFKVYLPKAARAMPPKPQQLEASARTEGKADGTLLVVEDEEPLRVLLVRVLQNAGFKVLDADCGEAAIQVFREQNGRIDLLLTDMVLPDMGGTQLAMKLTEEQKDLPVLFMSGYPTNANIHQGVLDESMAFLEKPFLPKTLLQKIQETLDRDCP